MGVRPALEKPLDYRNTSIDDPPSNGGNSNKKRLLDAAAVPSFGLLGPTEEERKRRRLVLGLSPLFEAVAVGIMFWALMSLPPNPLLNKVREQVLYFHPVAPEAAKQAPRLLERPVLPREMAAPITPKLQREHVQKPPEMARLRVPEITQPKIELPQAPPAPNPVEHCAAAEVPHPAQR